MGVDNDIRNKLAQIYPKAFDYRDGYIVVDENGAEMKVYSFVDEDACKYGKFFIKYRDVANVKASGDWDLYFHYDPKHDFLVVGPIDGFMQTLEMNADGEEIKEITRKADYVHGFVCRSIHLLHFFKHA